MTKNIQWYPGHMAKARRELQEKLKLVDIVLELVDARIPDASQNPELDALILNKPRIKVLMKADLADPNVSKKWQAFYESQDIYHIFLNAKNDHQINQLIQLMHQALGELYEKREHKGMKDRAMRAVVVGIPNVGKSTLINRFAGRNIAQTGDRPGVTKAQQWIKYKKELELLDIPGILWPKFEDQTVGMKLALTGAIKHTLYHADDVALFGLELIESLYPGIIAERYGFDPEWEKENYVDQLMDMTAKRGFQDDYLRGSEMFLNEFKKGLLGRMTLEKPEEAYHD